MYTYNFNYENLSIDSKDSIASIFTDWHSVLITYLHDTYDLQESQLLELINNDMDYYDVPWLVHAYRLGLNHGYTLLEIVGEHRIQFATKELTLLAEFVVNATQANKKHYVNALLELIARSNTKLPLNICDYVETIADFKLLLNPLLIGEDLNILCNLGYTIDEFRDILDSMGYAYKNSLVLSIHHDNSFINDAIITNQLLLAC